MLLLNWIFKSRKELKMMKNENGRSMVEMLGVLAIIGVLSIGGIAGYTIAMNRYRANEILDMAAKVSVLGMTKNGTDTAKMSDFTTTKNLFGVTNMEAGQSGVVKLTTKELSSGVANAIASIAGKKTDFTATSTPVTGDKYADFDRPSDAPSAPKSSDFSGTTAPSTPPSDSE